MEPPNDGRGQRDPRTYTGPQLPPTRAISLWHGGRQYAASVIQPDSQPVPDPYNDDTAPFYSPPNTFVPPESPNVPGPVLPSQLRPSSMHMQTRRPPLDSGIGMDIPNVNVHHQGSGPVTTNLAGANNGRFVLSNFPPIPSIFTLQSPNILDSPATIVVTHGSSNAKALSRSEAPNRIEQNTGTALHSSEAHGNLQNTSINLADYGIGVDPFPAYNEGHPGRLQRNTFPGLANERGLRPWNNSFFDDRWTVGSDERWLPFPNRSRTIIRRPEVHPLLELPRRPLSEIFPTGTTHHSSFNMDSLIGSFPDTAPAPVRSRRTFPRVRGTGGSNEYDPLAGYARLAGTDNNTSGTGSVAQGGETVQEVEPGKRVHPHGAIGDGRKKPSKVVGSGGNESSASGTVEGGRSGQNQSTAKHETGEPSGAAIALVSSAQYVASVFKPVPPNEHDNTDVSIEGLRVRQADLNRWLEQKGEEHKQNEEQLKQQEEEEEAKFTSSCGTLSGLQYHRNVSNLQGILQSVSEVPENMEPNTSDTFQGSALAVVGSSRGSVELGTEMRELDSSERVNQGASAEQSKQTAEEVSTAERQPQITDDMNPPTVDNSNTNFESMSPHRLASSSASPASRPQEISNQPATSQQTTLQSQALALNILAGVQQLDTFVPNTNRDSNMSSNPQQGHHFVRGADDQMHPLPDSNQNNQQSQAQNPQQTHVPNLAQGALQYDQPSTWDPYAADHQAFSQQYPAHLAGYQHQQLVANRHGGYTPLIPPGFEGLVGRRTDQRRFGGTDNVTPYTQQLSASTTSAIRAPRPTHTTTAAILGNVGARPTTRASSYQSLASPALGGPVVTNTEWPNRFGGTVNQPSAAPALPLLPHRPGLDAMYPLPAAGSSVALQHLTRDGQPTGETAMESENLPFGELARDTQPAGWGVVKFGNVPYSLTKAEVHAFLGRNDKILTSDVGEAIHIIMERSTGKTMDCYVEFFSVGDAQNVVNKLHRQRREGSRYLRMHGRNVEVEFSSQEALMKELFPRAKNVQWKGQVPVIVQTDEPFNSGFKAFLTPEELVMMVKHAEQPQRDPFTQKCPQRPYECLISTLYKFPWHATNLYTLLTRNQLYKATHDMIVRLLNTLQYGGGPGLTETLLCEVLIAGLNAFGFSERQKYQLKSVVEASIPGPLSGLAGGKAAVRMSPVMKFWPWEVLGRKAGVQEDVVLFYAYILSLSSATTLQHSSDHTRNLTESPYPALTNNPFGNITVPWPQDDKGLTAPGTMCTMQQAAAIEWAVLKERIYKVLGSGSGVNDEEEEEDGGVSLEVYEGAA